MLAVFGGSFNPPHLGHVLGVTSVLSLTAADRVMVIPTFLHPLGKSLAPYAHRVRMCELAMGWIPHVEVSRIEEELGGESRTLRTLEALRARNPDVDLRLVVGADILGEAAKWHRFDDVCRLAPLLVLGRAGSERRGTATLELPDVSSTEVRTWLAEGKEELLSTSVPRNVVDYAKEHALYGPR